MPNLRIVSDNAVGRAASLVASTTAGGLVAANLTRDVKSSVHRATGTSVTYTVTWTAAEPIGCVALPFCNLSPTATMRVRAYASNGTTVLYDSGAGLACPAPASRPLGFTAAQAASAYAYGGGACARRWFNQVSAFKLVIDIVDTANLQGYIEAACLVAGPVWSPKYNASATSVSVIDRTEISRSAAGDQLVDPGTMSRKVPVDLSKMSPADRAKFLDLLRNSRAYPVLLSVFPEHADLELERDHMLYGRRTKDSDIAYQFSSVYSTTFEIEEI